MFGTISLELLVNKIIQAGIVGNFNKRLKQGIMGLLANPIFFSKRIKVKKYK